MKTIQEENKLISEFEREENYTEITYEADNDHVFGVMANKIRRIPDYHKSWGSIMPVVSKCYNIWCFHYEETYDFDTEYLMNDTLPHHLKHVNLHSVHSCVVKFIEWYNQVKES